VPYIVTVFFFILYCNLLGLVPWGATPTGNINVTAALAIMTLVVVEVAGMRELGAKGYLGTIFYAPHGMHWAMRVPDVHHHDAGGVCWASWRSRSRWPCVSSRT
jgi:F-type H+-transporting ATPase subunit a